MQLTTQPRARKPRAKPTRAVRLVTAPTEDESGVLVLTVGKLVTPYFVDPIASDYGRAFSLQKFDGTGYDVQLGDPSEGMPPSCECPGFLRWGHRGPCKHLSSLAALKAAGRL